MLWVAVALVQVGAVRLVAWSNSASPAQAPASAPAFLPDSTWFTHAQPLSKTGQDSLYALAYTLMRDTQALRQLTAKLGKATPAAERDSILNALHVPAQLTPAQRDSFDRRAKALTDSLVGPILSGLAFPGLGRILALLATIVFGPPIVMIGVTVFWYRARNRPRAAIAV